MTSTLPSVRKVLFVGMKNPRGDEPFWPAPNGSAGERLWRMISDAVCWDRETFLSRTDRVNFCDGPSFSEERARARVDEIKAMMQGRRTVLVGEVVARLLDGPRLWLQPDDGVVAIPHTSGLNRFYNDQANREATVALLREMLA